LAEWYQRTGRPVQSHACAFAPDAGDAVLVRAPYMTMAPGRDAATAADLYKDISRGVFVSGSVAVSTDQQFGSIFCRGTMFEIERGKIVSRIREGALQSTTRNFWKSLTALGDSTTMAQSEYWSSKGHPWKYAREGASAPAAFFKDVDVISTNRPV
jgi:TldD protein